MRLLITFLILSSLAIGCKENSQQNTVNSEQPEQFSSDPVQRSLSGGYEAFEDGNFIQAIEAWETLDKDSEEYKAVMTDLGYAYYRDGNLDKAIELLAPIVNDTKNPYHQKAQWHLAQVYYAQQDFSSCATVLGDAILSDTHPYKIEIEQLLDRLEN